VRRTMVPAVEAVEEEMPQHGIVVWNELHTRDADRAKRFYATTLGWTFDGMPMDGGGTYWVAKVGDRMVGGVFTMSDPMFAGIPEHWLCYIEVDDVERRIADARQAGGEVLRNPFEVPGVGRIAIVKDPGGAVSGWMTSAAQSG
jgi:uncharacterized protein